MAAISASRIDFQTIADKTLVVEALGGVAQGGRAIG
jgi:hypothetical protein